MIIFLYGPDTYRLRLKLNEIIEHYKKIHKSGLNLEYFNLKEKEYQDFQDEFRSTSMFDEKKLIVFKNTSLNKEFQDKFLKEIKKFIETEDIVLFYEENEISKNKFFDSLKRCGKSQEFKPIGGERLKIWVKKEFEKLGAKIENPALENLINFVGNDLWQMKNEIEKLVSYKFSKRVDEAIASSSPVANAREVDETISSSPPFNDNQVVQIKDIELLVKPKIETDIFKTIDAIAQKNRNLALRLLHKHLEKGDSPLYLLSMINFQFRNLLMVKSHKTEQGLNEDLGMHPYVIRKTTEQARKFTTSELKKIYQKIFKVDLSIKTGKINPDVALDLLVTEI